MLQATYERKHPLYNQPDFGQGTSAGTSCLHLAWAHSIGNCQTVATNQVGGVPADAVSDKWAIAATPAPGIGQPALRRQRKCKEDSQTPSSSIRKPNGNVNYMPTTNECCFSKKCVLQKFGQIKHFKNQATVVSLPHMQICSFDRSNRFVAFEISPWAQSKKVWICLQVLQLVLHHQFNQCSFLHETSQYKLYQTIKYMTENNSTAQHFMKKPLGIHSNALSKKNLCPKH